MKLLREPEVNALTGRKRSANRLDIANGLMTQPVHIGTNAIAWPEHEILAINTARVAGRTDDDIRQLVTRLHTQRATADQAISQILEEPQYGH